MPQYAVNNPWAENMRGVSALAQALGGMIAPDNSRILQAQLVGAQRDSVYADTDLTNQKRYDLEQAFGGRERVAANLGALARVVTEGQTPPVSPIQVQGGALPVQMGDGLTVSQGGPDMSGLAGLLGGPGAAGAGQLEVAPAAPQPQVQVPQSLLAALFADGYLGSGGDTRMMQNFPGVLMGAGGAQVLGGDADLSRILSGFGTAFQNTPEAFTRDQSRLDTDSIRDNETQRYGYKTQAESSRYGYDKQYESSTLNNRADNVTSRANNADTNATNLAMNDADNVTALATGGGRGSGTTGRPATDGQEAARVTAIRQGIAASAGLGADGEVAPGVVSDGMARFNQRYKANGGDAGDALAFAIGDTPYMVEKGRVTFWRKGAGEKARRGTGKPLYGEGSANTAATAPPPGFTLIPKN